jgi:hypothetical protein
MTSVQSVRMTNQLIINGVRLINASISFILDALMDGYSNKKLVLSAGVV